MRDLTIPVEVRAGFELMGRLKPLSGGTRPAYRATSPWGELVLKRLHTQSLETEHSLVLAPWLADVLADIVEQGFRVAKPVRACDGRWLLAGGWAAYRYVSGRPARAEDVPDVIVALRALQTALSETPKHQLLDCNTTPFGFAARHCWEGAPPRVHPLIRDQVTDLVARYRPLPPLPSQLIHGDLNPGNILIAPGLPPGFIDLTPYWMPPGFGLANFANWIGPREGDFAVLRHFTGIPHFPQLLLREAVRMLLVVSELNGTGAAYEWARAPEKVAADIVLQWFDRQEMRLSR